MKICLLKSNGVSKKVEVSDDFGLYYEEIKFRKIRVNFNSNIDVPKDVKYKKIIYKRVGEFSNGLKIYAEDCCEFI